MLPLIACLFVACASEIAPEDLDQEGVYSFGGDAGALPSGKAETAPADTFPLPDAARNDGVTTPAGTPAPTPYGLTIEEDEAGNSLTTKGALSSTAASAPALAAQRLLSGQWINTEDAREHVEFTPTHYKTFYEGELLVEEDMTFHGQCPGACSGGTPTGEPCFTISGPAQTDCYGIVSLTDDRLELQLLGVSNETVVYRRAD